MDVFQISTKNQKGGTNMRKINLLVLMTFTVHFFLGSLFAFGIVDHERNEKDSEKITEAYNEDIEAYNEDTEAYNEDIEDYNEDTEDQELERLKFLAWISITSLLNDAERERFLDKYLEIMSSHSSSSSSIIELEKLIDGIDSIDESAERKKLFDEFNDLEEFDNEVTEELLDHEFEQDVENTMVVPDIMDRDQRYQSSMDGIRDIIARTTEKNLRERLINNLRHIELNVMDVETKIEKLDFLAQSVNDMLVEEDSSYTLYEHILLNDSLIISMMNDLKEREIEDERLEKNIEIFISRIQKLENLLENSQQILTDLKERLENRLTQINARSSLSVEEKETLRQQEVKDRLYVLGKILDYDVAPIIREGRTLVPLRSISEGLGALVDWNPDNVTVTIERNGVFIELQVNSNLVKLGEKEMNIDVSAEIISGRTFVPLRFVGEILGEEVLYDHETGEIDVGLNWLQEINLLRNILEHNVVNH
jgi:hypothetical protein